MKQHLSAVSPRPLTLAVVVFLLVVLVGCKGGTQAKVEKVGKYEVLPTITDDGKQEKCKSNAEDTLTRHPDLKCMVGLWAYNPPAILAAAKDAGKIDQVKIVGFDENEETLAAVRSGQIHGTIVQNPYMFGHETIRLLAMVIRGDKSKLPAGGIHFVPHKVIKKDNVDEYHAELKKLKGKPEQPITPDPEAAKQKRVKIAFITNNPYEFWLIAKRGCEDAAAKYNVELEFRMPPTGAVSEQNQFIEDLLSKGVQGITISPAAGKDQLSFLNGVAEKVPLFTHDSDLPAGSKRLCYIGTDNVEAGRAAGRLVKEALPAGGKVAIFVGSMDKQNAQERERGVKEALKD
jgi:ribose transport system substrate-binding protein